MQSFSDSRYLIQTSYNCPFALVFVDEATRWKEVVPLEDRTVTSHMKGFLYFRNRVIEAMAKLQSNPIVINKTNLFFEIELNWTGMMIEACPQAYLQMVKNRSKKKNIFIHGIISNSNPFTLTKLTSLERRLVPQLPQLYWIRVLIHTG